jgi:3-phosphoshikimate 1-carboxyvinyltransferase
MIETAKNAHPRSDFHVPPGGRLDGRLRIPGDKSISHRAVMLGALADGDTNISGLLEGEDVLRTVAAFRAMGVSMEGPRGGHLIVHGVGLDGLKAPDRPLDMGNSGTAMRLMAGVLAAQAFESELTGDASLSRRPMERVAAPLRSMGASIETAADGRPPLKISGGRPLRGMTHRPAVASAQVKSALLLAGLYADGETVITEPVPTRDHTERMLRGFGYAVDQEDLTTRLRGGRRLTGRTFEVPADISSAAFFLVAATIAGESRLILTRVGMNPTRIGVLNILRLMGADIEIKNECTISGEPVADVHVRSAKLQGIVIPSDQVPLAIDEFPAIFIAAACARGDTALSGAAELRVKESDRIAVMALGLKRLGIEANETPDGIVIRGGTLRGGTVDSGGDHRVAMAFATAALRAEGAIKILDCKNVDTSFPGFVETARGAGLKIETRTED